MVSIQDSLINEYSGCPGIYICVNCSEPFLWYETDGEAPAWCDDCGHFLSFLITPHSRPLRVASSDKWGVVIHAPDSWEKIKDIDL